MPILLTTLAGAACAMVLLWLLSLALRDASIVDVWWGPGLLFVGCIAWLSSPLDATPRSVGILLLTALWALRLGGYLLWRNWGEGEDPRYQAMRRHWGARFPWVSLLTVFLLQGILQWGVSLPVQVVAATGGPPGWTFFDVLGVTLFAVGLGFESIGDWQLARFKADPASRGQVMDRGLWRYTRHPNYFGDCCAWWGLYAIALSVPGAAWTAVGPLLMTVLLLRVSGVALLERSIGRRRPAYADYVARTSAFFPLPPRKRA